jgi:hypothetical protein
MRNLPQYPSARFRPTITGSVARSVGRLKEAPRVA